MKDQIEVKISSAAWKELRNTCPDDEKLSAIASNFIKRNAKRVHDIIRIYLDMGISEFHSLNISMEAWSVLETAKIQEGEDLNFIASKLILQGCKRENWCRNNTANRTLGIF